MTLILTQTLTLTRRAPLLAAAARRSFAIASSMRRPGPTCRPLSKSQGRYGRPGPPKQTCQLPRGHVLSLIWCWRGVLALLRLLFSIQVQATDLAVVCALLRCLRAAMFKEAGGSDCDQPQASSPDCPKLWPASAN